MFGKAYTLANVPGPPTAQSYSTNVFAYTNGEKKKRPEIALGVDGQGVNVYNIATARTVTSYLLSPRSELTCPPCSFRYRSRTNRAERSHTYCSIQSPRPRILHFLEERIPDKVLQNVTTHSISVHSDSPIVHLDVVPNSADTEDAPKHSLLAVHQDGTVRRYSAKLDKELCPPKMLHDPSRGSQGPGCVLLAEVISLSDAYKAILKQGEVLARHGSDGDEQNSSILVTLQDASTSRRKITSALTVCIYSISHNSRHDITSGEAIPVVLSQRIPLPSNVTLQDRRFSIHAPSATLYLQGSGELLIYSLKAMVPRLKYSIPYNKGQRLSSLHLSESLIAMCTQQDLDLIGLPYCSKQASVRFSDGQLAANAKLNLAVAPEPGEEIELLFHSKQHALLIARHGSRIVAIPYLQSSLGKRNRQGSLIDAIGRNASDRNQDRSEVTSKSKPSEASLDSLAGARDWNQIENDLDQLVQIGDHAQFDNIMITQLPHGGVMKDHAGSQRLHYVLDKMFTAVIPDKTADKDEIEGPRARRLDMVFWPNQTAQWMLKRGFLNTNAVESALKERSAISVSSRLDPGALINALARYDQSLQLLNRYLCLSWALNSTEIAHSLATIGHRIRLLDMSINHSRLLDDRPANENPAINGDEALVSKADDTSGSSLKVAKEALYMTLTRLNAGSPQELPQALRRVFSNSDMRSLVDILRLELAAGGWLSYAADENGVRSPFVGGEDTITLIAQALNLLLDALGPTGWMQGQPSMYDLAETAETISYMRAEVLAALEGIEEAVYLQHMLGEVLICGKEALHSTSKEITATSDRNAMSQPSRPMTVPLGEDSNLLPLGLKLKTEIPTHKVGAGGEIIKRSKRDMGLLKSRKVGKYSFERIDI